MPVCYFTYQKGLNGIACVLSSCRNSVSIFVLCCASSQSGMLFYCLIFLQGQICKLKNCLIFPACITHSALFVHGIEEATVKLCKSWGYI